MRIPFRRVAGGRPYGDARDWVKHDRVIHGAAPSGAHARSTGRLAT
jgi:hypothetical protein